MPQVSQTRIFHKICLTLFTEVSAYTVLFLQLLVSLKLQQNFEIVYKKTGYVIPIFQLWTSSTMGGSGLARVHCPWVAVRISLLKLQKNNPRSQGLFSFFSFYSCTHGIWKFPTQGSNWSCSCWPTPQPWQHWIQAISATHAAACSNTGSLIHGARPGVDLRPHRHNVGSLTHRATAGTPPISVTCDTTYSFSLILRGHHWWAGRSALSQCHQG